MRPLILLAAVAFSIIAISPETSPAMEPPARERPVLVEDIAFPVTLSDGHVYTVAGRVYLAPPVRHETLQLVVHGATYNSHYWDVPDVDGRAYSYARDMARRGYVVLSIDQLGAGRSDKPEGDSFSLDDAARALHQVAQQVREAAPHMKRGPHFKLAYVGHSNGSVTSIYAQGTYGDADELVVTGWDHGFRGLPVDPSDPDIQKAISTPYIQFRGPKRDVLMYFLGAADPAMIDFDDRALTDSMPRRQFLDLIGIHADITNRGPGGMTPLTRSELVKVPVLVQVGEHDDRIAPLSAAVDPPGEAAFYANSSDFTLQVLPAIGHCVNLHLTHRESWDGIDRWLSAHE